MGGRDAEPTVGIPTRDAARLAGTTQRATSQREEDGEAPLRDAADDALVDPLVVTISVLVGVGALALLTCAIMHMKRRKRELPGEVTMSNLSV